MRRGMKGKPGIQSTERFGYRCVAPAHSAAKPGVDHITIYARKWAFCAFDSTAPGHEWRPTGSGETLVPPTRRAKDIDRGA